MCVCVFAAQGSKLYGLQLLLQLFIAHLIPGQTVSVVVTASCEDEAPQVSTLIRMLIFIHSVTGF
jgi:hypothetical protein